MPKPTTCFDCLSWNIHRGRGEDGVVDPARTVDVLCREVARPDTDLLVLQEADEECPPHRGILDIAGVEGRTGLHRRSLAAGARAVTGFSVSSALSIRRSGSNR